jgi:hypothetical protein
MKFEYLFFKVLLLDKEIPGARDDNFLEEHRGAEVAIRR